MCFVSFEKSNLHVTILKLEFSIFQRAKFQKDTFQPKVIIINKHKKDICSPIKNTSHCPGNIFWRKCLIKNILKSILHEHKSLQVYIDEKTFEVGFYYS